MHVKFKLHIRQHGRSHGDIKPSTDSGQGTEPLSDTFIAVTAGGRYGKGLNQPVEAPEGSSNFKLLVRRSVRVTSSESRSRSVLASARPNNTLWTCLYFRTSNIVKLLFLEISSTQKSKSESLHIFIVYIIYNLARIEFEILQNWRCPRRKYAYLIISEK